MKKDFKRANGTGTVYKLGGRRSRPYAAIITTSCKTDDKHKYVQSRRAIGYFTNKEEAYLALMDYVKSPYNLDERAITFGEVYKKWSDTHYTEISGSAVRTWKSAYSYLTSLDNMRFIDIRPRHIEECIRNAPIGSSTKQRMKSLCSLLFKYAIKNEIAKVNYAELCDTIKTDPPKIIRSAFSRDEIDVLWEESDNNIAEMLLISIYSGWRPNELLELKIKGVNIEEGYFIGGSKTSAGKNRIVPIHKKVLPLIERKIYSSESDRSLYLFPGNDTARLTYYGYRHKFAAYMNYLGMEHRPHDTRHTFITLAKEAGVDEYILKLIVGHSIDDITERVYTHRSIEKLSSEINKII